MLWIDDPPERWANPTDCSEFTCTAPDNIVMTFEGAFFKGENMPNLRKTFFQIVSDNAGVSSSFDECEFKEEWNAWICQNDYLGMLNVQADDGDWEDRSVVPVYFTN